MQAKYGINSEFNQSAKNPLYSFLSWLQAGYRYNKWGKTQLMTGTENLTQQS